MILSMHCGYKMSERRRRSWTTMMAAAVAMAAISTTPSSEAFSPSNGVPKLHTGQGHAHIQPVQPLTNACKKKQKQRESDGKHSSTDLHSVTMMSPTRPLHGVIDDLNQKVKGKARTKSGRGGTSRAQTSLIGVDAHQRRSISVSAPISKETPTPTRLRLPKRKSTVAVRSRTKVQAKRQPTASPADSFTRKDYDDGMRQQSRQTVSLPGYDDDAGVQEENKKRKFVNKLLTLDDEKRYTLQIQALRRAIRLRDGLEKKDPEEQEWADACGLSIMDLRRVMHLGREANSILISANAGLVVSIAKRYYFSLERSCASNGSANILSLADMVQEGNLGLMMAAERFEPERNLRFSTYATYWIRQRILLSISTYSRAIRLPSHVHVMLAKVYKTRNKLRMELARDPSDKELASELDITEERLLWFSKSTTNVISLEKPIGQGNERFVEDKRTIGDMLACGEPSPEENAHNQNLRSDIREVMDGLEEHERNVLVLRFGLDERSPALSIQKTADRLKISRDKVRRIEAQALKKLRNPLRNYRLKEYVSGMGMEHPPQSKPRTFYRNPSSFTAIEEEEEECADEEEEVKQEPRFPFNFEPYNIEQEQKQSHRKKQSKRKQPPKQERNMWFM